MWRTLLYIGGLHLVRRANVDLWQRAYALSSIAWIGAPLAAAAWPAWP